MIVRRRCPYTGVINFYSDAEPHLPLGSIAVCGRSADVRYAWRAYSDDKPGGAAPDLAAAEQRLLQRIVGCDVRRDRLTDNSAVD